MRFTLNLLAATIAVVSLSHGQETIRVGAPMLAGATLPLGTTYIESFKVEKGIHTPINQSIQTIVRSVEDGVPVYQVSIVHWAIGGDSALTSITLREKDFSLLRHKVKAPRDSAVVMYSSGHLSGWVVLPERPILLIDAKVPALVFPLDGPSPWLLSAFPLGENLSIILPRYSMWDNREVLTELKVVGTETLERGGMNIDCWKVDNGPFAIPGYRAYRWVDKKTKKILQTVLRGKADQPEYWSIAE